MKGLTTALLGRACRIFLTLAYPEGPDGESTIPAAKRGFLRITDETPLETCVLAPVCQAIPLREGGGAGYSFRLGCATYPNLKMQVVDCDNRGTWVFSVNTHDTMLPSDPNHPDAAGIKKLQETNRQIKLKIEDAWEREGLLTFNKLLRDQIDDMRRL